MNGSGTLADPFIITSPDEFCAMQSGNCYALGCDIDFGSTPYSSDVSGIVLGDSLDGRGHKVRNIVCNSPNSAVDLFLVGTSVTVTDTVFENIRLTGQRTAVFSGSGSAVTLRRCSFSVKSTWTTNATVTDCIFNSGTTVFAENCNFVMLAMWTKQRSLFRDCTLKSCQVRFTMKSNTARSDYETYPHILYACTLDECTFYADITVNNSDIMLFSNSSTYIGCCFRMAAHGTFQFWWLNDIIPTVSAADRSQIENTVATNFTQAANLKFITPAQMKDAEYLTSIGIDCVEVDE